jgi:O-acetyl-ADP-ribose deacetylase (regulator of RNase III)
MDLTEPTNADIVRRATAATLWKAEELGARSLALVAFGTGVGRFPVAEAAAIEVEEVRQHLASGSRLERIVFAVRGDAARAAFEQALGS